MTNYGKATEVSNAHIQNIMLLPQISNSNRHKIHQFSGKLQSSVQVLDTMEELNKRVEPLCESSFRQIIGCTSQSSQKWWQLAGLLISTISRDLEKFTDRNPIPISEKGNLEKGKSFQTRQGKSLCAYCEKPGCKSV